MRMDSGLKKQSILCEHALNLSNKRNPSATLIAFTWWVFNILIYFETICADMGGKWAFQRWKMNIWMYAESTPPISALIEIACKMWVTKSSFISLQTHWLIQHCHFLEVQDILIILVEQYESSEKMHLKFQRWLFLPILLVCKRSFWPTPAPCNLTRVYFSVGIPLCADGGTKRYAKNDMRLKKHAEPFLPISHGAALTLSA